MKLDWETTKEEADKFADMMEKYFKTNHIRLAPVCLAQFMGNNFRALLNVIKLFMNKHPRAVIASQTWDIKNSRIGISIKLTNTVITI
jgi:hypothetical protein